MTVEEFATALLASLERIASGLAKNKPTRIVFALPTITRNGKTMNFELKNDTVAAIAIHTKNDNGDLVPAPEGDVFTAVSSDPAKMTAVIGVMPAGGPLAGTAALILTPLVKLAPALTATVSDADGLSSEVLTVDVVADLTPKAISLDVVDAVLTPQAVPAA